MELRTFWTDSARYQLEDIFDYYKNKANIRIARKLVKRIIERTIQLEQNPNSGAKELLLSNRKFEYRYLVEGNYKIVYWKEDNYLKIAAVFDSRQNPEKLKVFR
ncbi:MAG TPA: type II toxin-antitoxin system RelE/ParE family toxin [Bacteroidales bacterium]|nr:type II toxin-antitoxin system RelE/ParE family toxin [Bacteroidales bacterium]HRX95501.1 type II toxin-antitoxin system RelE/ParE family toxin [Bacteroidales bacterium]